MSRRTPPSEDRDFDLEARVERLTDARIDASRGGPDLSSEDAVWLAMQLAADADLAARIRQREEAVELLRREPLLLAPDGFADRVLRFVETHPRPEEPVRSRLSMVVAACLAVAAGLTLFVLMMHRPVLREDGVVISGAGAAQGSNEADFIVRPTDFGPAAARVRLTALAADHHGEVFAIAGGLMVRLPREALVGALQDLARQGRFRVRKVSRHVLPPEQAHVFLRVELD